MRARALLVLLAAPALLSAADPVALAEQELEAALAEQQRLEEAAARSRDSASRAAAEAAVAAEALTAAEARIALSEAKLAQLGRGKAALEQRLAEVRRPATALTGGLVELARRPALLALAETRTVSDQVRLAALVRAVRPEVERRSGALRAQLDALRRLTAEQERVTAALSRERSEALSARARFVTLERSALAAAATQGAGAVQASDAVLDRSERLAALTGAAERRKAATRLAASLSDLPGAEPRPVAAEGRPPPAPFAWAVPASGPITVGTGELLPNGVRARGLLVASAPGTQVIAPAAGRIAFAGPFRRREGVLILDHGNGWKTLLTDVRPSVEVGAEVVAGDAIGRAAGPVGAELFRDGRPEPAALIARSSATLLRGSRTR